MINLLSPEIKQARRYAKYNVMIFQYIVIVVVSVAAMSGLMLLGQQTLEGNKAELEKLIAADTAKATALEPVIEDAKALAATVQTIGTLLEQEVKFSFVLQEIGSIIPPGVVLSAISLSQDTSKPITLDVNLTSAERAGVLQQNLIESDLFISADIIQVTVGAVPGFGFSGQVQAYFNPDLPLNTLDDPPAEETPAAEATTEPAQETEPTTEETTETEATPSEEQPAENSEEGATNES